MVGMAISGCCRACRVAGEVFCDRLVRLWMVDATSEGELGESVDGNEVDDREFRWKRDSILCNVRVTT